MRFFTRCARFAVAQGSYSLWKFALILGGESLAAADVLVAAANSRNPLMWETVRDTLAKDFMDPACVEQVLYGVAESTNHLAFLDVLEHAARLGIRYDADRLLAAIARKGCRPNWKHATEKLHLRPTLKGCEGLVDAALLGRDGVILDDLQTADYLPFSMKERIKWKRHLDSVVAGRNIEHIHSVMDMCQNLKPQDYAEAEAFLGSVRYHYPQREHKDPFLHRAA